MPSQPPGAAPTPSLGERALRKGKRVLRAAWVRLRPPPVGTATVSVIPADGAVTATAAAAPDPQRKYAKKLRAASSEISFLREELAKATKFEYGSYSPGVQKWNDKWKGGNAPRVLYYAPKDYSGSFFKWAWAINETTDVAVRLATFRAHRFGYESDLLLPDPSLDETSGLRLVEEADIIHIKDEHTFFQGQANHLADAIMASGKPVVFTHYGGYARKYKDDSGYRDFVGSFAARVAMTPDLAYDWFDGEFIPHAIDADRYQYSWRDGHSISHSPSMESRKGTEDLRNAVNGLDLTLDLIQDVSHEECLLRKQQSSIFFDQAGRERSDKLGVSDVIGWYGNSALEAAVHGIPTIAHLSDVAIERAEACGVEIRGRCGIINTPLGADGIRQTLQRFLDASSDERAEISLKTRRWIEEFHSYPVVAGRLAALYSRLL